MRFTLFLLAAIVLAVFAILAGAATSGLLFSVQWYIWLSASFLAYLVDIATAWAPWGATTRTAPPA